MPVEKQVLLARCIQKLPKKPLKQKILLLKALTLQKGFQEMVEADVDMAVMEVSSHALDLGRVHGCDFNVAVFTNLTQDHLDYHQTMDEYLHAKSLLFAQLGNTFNEHNPKFADIKCR